MLVTRKNQALLLSTLFAGVQIFTPLTAVAQPKAQAAAPASAIDPAAAGSGPIDIQAHEQEFSGDHVIAKGNVKVLYKDTVILAPLATLYRDLSSGQPQKAIFTGHPWLTQGANKIDADQLIFEMTTSKIFADGHAHSEVVNNDPTPINEKKKNPAGAMPTAKGGMAPNGKGGFEWPTQESDRKKAQTSKQSGQEEGSEDMASEPTKESAPEKKDSKKTSGKDASKVAGKDSTKDSAKASSQDASDDTKTASIDANDALPGEGGATAEPKPAAVSRGPLSGGSTAGSAGGEAPTKIITDSNRQEYDRDSGRFEAFGNVKVIAGDIHVTADHLKLAYGIDHRPEAAIFDGHVNALQDKNNTSSDFMTYFLITKRLQASGHVRSKVIQEKTEAKPVPKKQEEGVIKPISNVVTPDAQDKSKHSVIALNGLTGESKAPIIIVADSQDYNKETGRLDAIGNAKIFFEDTVGIGPKVILMKNADGQAEKIIFVGRSQVTQKGKRWIGDRVTIMVADRRIIAEGNTKAVFLQKKDGVAPGGMPGAAPFTSPDNGMMLAQPKPKIMAETPANQKVNTDTQAQIADPNNRQLSASKVNRPE